MRLVLSILFILSINSCGKNAFRNKPIDEPIVRTPGSSPGDENCESPKLVSLDPSAIIHTMHNDFPFLFTALKQRDYTNEFEIDPITGLGGYKIVEQGQIVLPFDFKPLENINAVIKKIYLTFDTQQTFKYDWKHHRSQLCHSYNKSCSGDLSSVVDVHINPHQMYTWVNDHFSHYVESFAVNPIGTFGYKQRKFSGLFNMLPYFPKELNLIDLPSNYFIVISDDHLLDNSKLHIEYCAQ